MPISARDAYNEFLLSLVSGLGDNVQIAPEVKINLAYHYPRL